MPNVVPCDKDTLSGGLRGEAGIEIYCNGGFSNGEIKLYDGSKIKLVEG